MTIFLYPKNKDIYLETNLKHIIFRQAKVKKRQAELVHEDNPSSPNPGGREQINLNFYLHTSL